MYENMILNISSGRSRMCVVDRSPMDFNVKWLLCLTVFLIDNALLKFLKLDRVELSLAELKRFGRRPTACTEALQGFRRKNSCNLLRMVILNYYQK